MQFPDFSSFELENSELLSLKATENTLLMEFSCPVLGWRWKSKLFRWFNFLNSNKNMYFADLEYQVELKFIGVESMSGTLIDEAVGSISESCFANGSPVLNDVRFVKTSKELGIAFFEFDEGTLEISFRDCIQRQVSTITTSD
jgi:hypothetical protein